MQSSNKLDLSTILGRIEQEAENRSRVRKELSPDRQHAQQIAAILPSFGPLDRLLGAGGESAGEILTEDVVPTGPNQPHQWRLRPDVQRQALKSLRDPQYVAKLLDEIPPGSQPLAPVLKQYLSGSAKPIEAQSTEELRASVKAVHLLSQMSLDLDLPQEAAIRRRIDELDLLEGFRDLTRGGVVGRTAELDQLRRFVGVVAAESWQTMALQEATYRVTGWLRGGRRPPLLIHGPGGIGKSTLLGAFILEHVHLPEGDRIPYAYLDFERASLSVRDPFGLILEIARQLRIQFPGQAGAFDEMSGLLLSAQMRQMDTGDPGEVMELGAASKMRGERIGVGTSAVELLADALDTLGGSSSVPFLLVLDSFEDAQYRSPEAVALLWELMSPMYRRNPLFRVVVSGRAPTKDRWSSDISTEVMELKPLDRKAATQLLVRQRVPEEDAKRVSSRFGGNPLTLRLVAKVYRKESERGATRVALDGGSWFWAKADEALIQGQLYHRILHHVDNPRVAKLAHPGLVLRRITPELVLHVLAGPCGLKVEGIQEAEELVRGLAREVDLVDERGGVLYHREDVRRTMLALMERERPDLVETIERNAADYYRGRDSLEDKAEEIYHRLRLGGPLDEVEALWQPGIEQYLDDAIEEMPARGRAFLEARLGGRRIQSEVLAEADLGSWELATLNRATSYLEIDDPQAALKVLGERKERSGSSPLYGVEARALAASGQEQKAMDVVGRGLSNLDPSSRAQRMELHLIAGQLLEGREAVLHLEAALGYARRGSDRAAEIRVAVAHASALMSVDEGEAEEAIARLASEIVRLPPTQLTLSADLARRVTDLIGSRDELVTARMLPFLLSGGVPSFLEGPLLEWAVRWAERSEAAMGMAKEIVYAMGFTPPEGGDGMKDVTRVVAEEGKLPELLARILATRTVAPTRVSELLELLSPETVPR